MIQKKKYCKPSIKIKRIKMNFFYRSRSRSLDSINSLFAIDVLASSHGCGGGGGKGIEEPI